jgi:hypothetical protein
VSPPPKLIFLQRVNVTSLSSVQRFFNVGFHFQPCLSEVYACSLDHCFLISFIWHMVQRWKTLTPGYKERFVRIRQRTKRQLRIRGKPAYKQRQLELTIPSKFRDLVEPFLNKDLKFEAKRVGNKIVIEVKPV